MRSRYAQSLLDSYGALRVAARRHSTHTLPIATTNGLSTLCVADDHKVVEEHKLVGGVPYSAVALPVVTLIQVYCQYHGVQRASGQDP